MPIICLRAGQGAVKAQKIDADLADRHVDVAELLFWLDQVIGLVRIFLHSIDIVEELRA